MSNDPQTEYTAEEREINTWCGECRGWQPHTLTNLGHGRLVLKCLTCHAETHSKDKGADDNAQLELFA